MVNDREVTILREIAKGDEKLFQNYCERRNKGEPVAYITGYKEFWSIDIQVSPAVLIPRPETEHLVETALQKIPKEKPMRILDFGTGSGCILAALATERPLATLVGVDCSEEALAIAEKNLAFVKERIQLICAPSPCPSPSKGEGKGGGETFDILLSNPPYIPTAVCETLQPEVRDYEPRLALDGGPDGLAIYRQIFQDAPKLLKNGGWLLLEMGIGQRKNLFQMFEAAGFTQIAWHKDLAGIDRVIEGTWTN